MEAAILMEYLAFKAPAFLEAILKLEIGLMERAAKLGEDPKEFFRQAVEGVDVKYRPVPDSVKNFRYNA